MGKRIKPTPGAFFEVTGTEPELFSIIEGINRNDGRHTASDSMTLDLWQEMLEEWFARRNAQVARNALMQSARVIRVELATNEVSKAQQDRMKYAIGFLEASAEEYRDV